MSTSYSLLNTTQALQNLGLITSTGLYNSNISLSNINFTGSLTQNGVAFTSGGGGGATTTSNSFIPASNAVYDLGSVDTRWRNLYLSGNSISFGSGATITAQNWTYLQNFVLPAPQQSSISTSINYVFSGAAQNHSALIQDGKLYTFGNNTYGQLGQNNTSNYGLPTLVPGISNAVQVVCGQSFTVIRTTDCNVIGMGQNSYGQLGINPSLVTSYSNPVQFPGVSNIINVACGWDYTMLLSSNNNIYGLGNGSRGQLGNGQITAINSNMVTLTLPTASNGSSAQTIAGYVPSMVTCGAAHTCIVLKNGMAYLCGDNTSNQLGVASTSVAYAATPGVLTTVQTIAKAACGTYHTLVAQNFGDVYAFGANGQYQLGMGNTSNYTLPQKTFSYLTITSSNVAYSSNIGGNYTFDGGQAHNILGTGFSSSNYPTYVWGDNTYGQTGLGQSYANVTTPTLLAGIYGIQVGCGQYHSVVLKSDTNTFVGFGNNNYGQMGDANMLAGASTVRYFPNTISPTGTKYTKVLGGGCTAVNTSVIDTDGTLYICGANNYGAVGCEFAGINASNAMPVSSFDQRILKVAHGYYHTVAIDGYNKVYSWGFNNNGQLGNSTSTNSSIPILISGFGSLVGVSVIAIACGYYSTIALDSTGKVHSWGYNGYGQLGNNTVVQSSIPIAVSGFGSLVGVSIVAIAAGGGTDDHTIALDSLGKVHAWGRNAFGQLGNNITVDSTIPIAVSGFGSLIGVSIVAIACGFYHTVALDSIGKVHSWGRNNNGQLGNNTVVDSKIPIAVSGYGSLVGTSIVAIACGEVHTIALDSLGKVHAWGYNGNCSLGNNTYANSQIPIAISGFGSLVGASIVVIASCDINTVALDSIGRVHSWGNNAYGQLGNNTLVDSLIPIIAHISFGTVRSSAGIIKNTSGVAHYLSKGYGFHKIIRPLMQLGNAVITPAGDNSYGQLGDGSQSARFNSTGPMTFSSAVIASANSLYHSAVVLSTGATYVWGNNSYYECGVSTGGILANATASLCAALSGYFAVDVACGTGITLILTSTGTVVALGTNLTGMLGNGSALNTTTQSSGAVVVTGLTDIKAIGAGENHAYAIDGSGYLWLWGANTYGQFGNGTITTALVPVMIPMASTGGYGVIAASVGYGHTLIINTNNACMAAGLNYYGQLGMFTNMTTATANSSFATVIFPASSAGIPCETYPADVACGMHHSIVLMANGTIRCFGLNDKAQLGLAGGGAPSGTLTSLASYPPLVMTANTTVISAASYGNGTYVASASSIDSAGFDAFAAFSTRTFLTNNAWLSFYSGKYSSASYIGSTTTIAGSTTYYGEWLQLQLPAAITLTKLKMANYSNTPATGPNLFYVMGSNNGTTWVLLGTFKGRFNIYDGYGTYYLTPTTATYSYFRIVVNSLIGISIEAGISQLLLYAGFACCSTPVKPYQYRNVCSISASVNTTYIEPVLGREMASYNSAGTNLIAVFTKVRSYGLFEWASGEDIIGPISISDSTSVLVTKSGNVHTWGNNANGQLGNNTIVNSSIPIGVSSFGSLANMSIIAIACGSLHTVAVDTTGKVHSWGANGNGQLGNNTVVDSLIPIAVSGFGYLVNAYIVKIACGYSHTVALDSTGKVYSWGYNNGGQLGNNGTSSQNQAILTSNYGSLYGINIVQIAAGYWHTVALDSTGKVHAWGYNGYGQLGNNTITNSSIPIAISSFGSLVGTSIVAIATGGDNGGYIVALDSTGKVHSWGYNGYGQLGNNTLVRSLIPIAVSGFGSLIGTSIVAIACGIYHTIALDSTGKVHSWGYNGLGQLGNNTVVNSSIPIAVSGYGSLVGKSIVAIACGFYHTIALDSFGTVHAWGYNNNGQLGNNTVVQSMIPIFINFGSLSTGLMGSIFWNFTGQHRCFVEGYSSKDLKNIEGLVVCANRNKYVTTDATTGDYEFLTGAKAITTNDALPVLSLANKSMDKTAFGVVSLTTNYNPAPDPTDIQLRKALEEGDQRAEINAVGEGGMWICDAGGNLESGDYITTSMIPGYGMRQIDDCIRNYTVAKITMDCDFNPPLIPDQTLCKDAIGNNILDEKGMPTYSTVLTPPIYSQAITTVDVGTGTISNPEQTLIDAGGQPVLSPAYKMRYLNLDGSQITEEEYNAAETTQVYKAAFVGCTYHCG